MRILSNEATAGLGAHLARDHAQTVGIFGSGGMARSLAMAYEAVRPITTIKAYSPTREHLLAYCEEASSQARSVYWATSL